MIPFVLYLASTFFGVLFFGAIHTWSYTLVFLGVLAAGLLQLRSWVLREPGGAASLRWIKTDLTPLFFLFLAFLVLQMVPLPPRLLLFLSPEAKINGDMSMPAASSLDPAVLKGQWYSLAAYLYPVRMSLVRWIVYGLLFFGLTRCLDSRKRIDAAVVAILVLGVVDALYGIMQTYSGYSHIWWFKNLDTRSVSGTYLNRNHFAGMMAMGIALAIAYAAAMGRPEEDPGSGSRHRRHSLKRRFLEFFSGEGRQTRRFLVIFAGGVMGLALILSASRGGIIATAIALLLMGLFFHSRRSERRKGRIILIIFAIAFLYGLYAGLDYTIQRFERFEPAMKDRQLMARKALDVFRDYRLTGVGLGNFRYASGRFQEDVHKNLTIDYAHNDYAQFLAEAGGLGALLLAAGLGWYMRKSFRLWRGRSDPFAVCLGIAPLAALAALAIHSWSDYNLHRPANVMLLIAILAIGNAAIRLEVSRRSEHHSGARHRERVHYDERRFPLRWQGLALILCAAGMIIWSGVWTVRHFMAELWCNTEQNITLNLDQNPPAEKVRWAMGWDSANAGYPFLLSQALMNERDRLMQQPEPDTEGWRRSHGTIITLLERAIRLNPLNAEYHVRLGWEYSYLWDRPDHLTRWLPAGDLCMDRAAWFAGDWPQNPRLQYDMGNYWTMRAKTLGLGSPRSEAVWTKAVWHFRKGMELEKRKELPDHIKAFIKTFFTDPEHLQDVQ